MKKLMKSTKRIEENETMVNVLKLELNYELAVLYEAIQNNNEQKIKETKERLEEIRKDLIYFNAL